MSVHGHSHADHDHAPDHDHDHGEGGHGHSHGHGHGHAHGHSPVDTGDWRYAVALIVNLVFVACEFAAGFAVNSTALLADAGHNLTDVLGLAMAGGAAVLARMGGHGRAGGRRTYGLGKATVLAALGNALLLIFACGAIVFEAVSRFTDPAPTHSLTIMAVAGVGFILNLATALLFIRSQHDLNARGAYLHMMADAGVSLGVVVAGGLMMMTGWSVIDPIVSLIIVAVILWSTWGLFKDSVNLAMDGAPAHIDVARLEAALAALPGVTAVHDLHVWGLSTSEAALTAHLVHDRTDALALLQEAQSLAKARFGVNHTTLQLESEPLPDCPGC
ncbi:cation diffusion facilitator family transporter [Brevundimonas sp. SORGH_AS_0993]|uniref:cation diffusion facilitator family transporter n=1 Tax=Brevundimonas sp. SORGH_AS_0993 TaxID=3041794 RepID=UPI00277DA67A|nr:cation diffusion facilitator family transporter [Brevundimonas sp. SORGH_AS_0993]MDQ1154695.1 cobalt-zinc-cadmium efflux system protein [Brevundimonas sp. SORGH_AS_0993]